jgi:REP element-mobilizing transposase RayT
MPNHVQAIVTLDDAPAAGARLGDVVGAFKSITTNAYICGIRDLGWDSFERRLWQRNYYERIMRSDTEIARVHDYIEQELDESLTP